MAPRLKLHEALVQALGSRNVYFQPPATVKIQYPCLLYSLSRIDTDFADNGPYRHKKRYQVIHITQDPDSPTVDTLSFLPLCRFDRYYTADNLNHYVFNLYY